MVNSCANKKGRVANVPSQALQRSHSDDVALIVAEKDRVDAGEKLFQVRLNY